MSGKLVFDIETVGFDFDSMDSKQQEYLLKYAKTEEEINAIKEGLGLYPLTGRIVCIGMYNIDSGLGYVMYLPNLSIVDNVVYDEIKEDNVSYVPLHSEKDILERFWDIIKKYNIYITFNGRSFDIPFIRIRSAILGIQCSIELMTSRFKNYNNNKYHIDLLEELTFQGVTKKFSLDFYCRAFGIPSPKQNITGYDVANLMKEGKGLEVAKYCYGDVIATALLFEKWNHSYNII